MTARSVHEIQCRFAMGFAPTAVTERIGEIAGVGASLTWAVSCLIFSRAAVPAGALNLFKNMIAAALFVAALAGGALIAGEPLLQASTAAIGWLVLSSVIGIVVGDIFYFRCLQILGARRALVMTTVVPPLAAGFGWLALDETTSWLTGLGMLITLGGVSLVVGDTALQGDAPGHFPGSRTAGVVYGCLGSLCQASQSVLSKLAMATGVDPFEAAGIRLVTAVFLGLGVGLVLGRLRGWAVAIRASGFVWRLVLAAVCGTFFGIWFSLVAFKHSPLAVATTLTTLSPVFILPLAAMLLRQGVSRRAVLGVMIALGGVVVLGLGF